MEAISTANVLSLPLEALQAALLGVLDGSLKAKDGHLVAFEKAPSGPRGPTAKTQPRVEACKAMFLEMAGRPEGVTAKELLTAGGQAFVYVVKGDTVATRATVELGSRQPALVEVTSGLGEGQKVVKTGHQKLYEGARVAPMEGAMTGRPGGQQQEGGTAQ